METTVTKKQMVLYGLVPSKLYKSQWGAWEIFQDILIQDQRWSLGADILQAFWRKWGSDKNYYVNSI